MFAIFYATMFRVILTSTLLCSIMVSSELSDYGPSTQNKTKTRMQQKDNIRYKCIHCASPRGNLKNKTMSEAMDQLLELRGTEFPFGFVDPNCGRKFNLSMITHKEECRYPYCYTITFNDKQGSPLLIRGCAEHFMASSKFARLDKGFCKKVHQHLDITECVCRDGDSCSPSSSSKNYAKITFTLIFISLSMLFC